MKTLVMLAVGAFLALGIGGCTKEDIKPSPDNIIISVDLGDIKEDIYMIDMSYYLKSDIKGGMASMNADGSKLGDRIDFVMCENDFTSGTDLQDFSFHLTLCPDKDGTDGVFSDEDEMVSTNVCDVFEPEYGKVYEYKVEGDLETGLELIREGEV